MKDERIWRNRYQVTADHEKGLKKKSSNSEVGTLIIAVLCGFFLAICFIIYLNSK